MYVVIRQYSKNLACRTTRSRRALTARDVRMAETDAKSYGRVEEGYYEVSLTPNPNDADATIDSIVAIK